MLKDSCTQTFRLLLDRMDFVNLFFHNDLINEIHHGDSLSPPFNRSFLCENKNGIRSQAAPPCGTVVSVSDS